MKDIKVGIVGLGRLGSVHAQNLAFKIPGCKLVAACSLEQKELERKMVFEAGAAFSGGMSFCEEGRGFLRMNIATPRANVLGALARAADVLAKI